MSKIKVVEIKSVQLKKVAESDLKSVEYLTRRERREIYNALCCLNIAIRDKQKQRARFVQKLIEKFSLISKSHNLTKKRAKRK